MTRARCLRWSLGGLALCVCSVAACGDDTPSLAEQQTAAILGVWEEHDEAGSLRSIWSFEARHRYAYDRLPVPLPEDADHVEGTFQITDSGLLQLDGVSVGEKQRRQTSWTYYLAGDLLAPETFVVERRDAGVIGTWRHEGDIALYALDGTLWTRGHVVQRLELTADGRARRTHAIDDHPPEILEGRYEALGTGGYRVLLDESGATLSLTLQLVNDAVLAPLVLSRKSAR